MSNENVKIKTGISILDNRLDGGIAMATLTTCSGLGVARCVDFYTMLIRGILDHNDNLAIVYLTTDKEYSSTLRRVYDLLHRTCYPTRPVIANNEDKSSALRGMLEDCSCRFVVLSYGQTRLDASSLINCVSQLASLYSKPLVLVLSPRLSIRVPALLDPVDPAYEKLLTVLRANDALVITHTNAGNVVTVADTALRVSNGLNNTLVIRLRNANNTYTI